MKTNTKKLLGIAVVIFAILITAFISGCMDGANGTNEEPEIESGNEQVLTNNDTQTEPRSPVNVNTALGSPEDAEVETSLTGDLDDVRITAGGQGDIKFEEYWDTVVLVDEAGTQVNECPADGAGGPQGFGSVIYLPSDNCEVYITCSGVTYCNKYGRSRCDGGITDIILDGDKRFRNSDALPESYRQECVTEGLPHMTVNANLNGGFHRITCYHWYELSYRHLTVAYHCKPKEKESAE